MLLQQLRINVLVLVSFITILGLPILGHGQNVIETTRSSGSFKVLNELPIESSINLKVDARRLRSEGLESFSLPLPNGTRITLNKDRTSSPLGGRGFVWVGRIQGNPSSVAIFSVVDDAVAADIYIDSTEMYQVRSVGNGVHTLSKIAGPKSDNSPTKPTERSPNRLAINDSLLKSNSTLKTSNLTSQSSCPDSPRQIDAMAVYENLYVSQFGSKSAVEAKIFVGVEFANQIMIDSQINTRIRLVHIAEIPIAATGQQSSVLSDMRTDNAQFAAIPNILGGSDPLSNLRNKHGADVVTLFSKVAGAFAHSDSYCSQCFGTVGESFGFSIAELGLAGIGGYQYFHGLGHIMGADHQNGASDLSNTSATARACYFPVRQGWTVMKGGFFVLPLLSGIPGEVCDNPGNQDNRQEIDLASSNVSAYRCSSPGVANVWMKDLWEDTGLEPDPNVNEVTWASPYIWVRNQQDANRVFQHQSQNAVAGQPNFVYVKVQNGGAATTGVLRVYWADGSTFQSWPTAWNEIGQGTNVNLTSATGSQILEIPWIPPNPTNANGHYCLIARWETGDGTDPMTTPEGTDTWFNIIGNNNIAGRNVTIVEIPPSLPERRIDLLVRSLPTKGEGIQLSIIPTDESESTNFLKHGQVTVEFEKDLLSAWAKSGRKGTGFRFGKSGFQITSLKGADFGNILADRKRDYRVTLKFKSTPSAQSGVYLIDAIQRHANGKLKGRPTGGMRFEVDTRVRK